MRVSLSTIAGTTIAGTVIAGALTGSVLEPSAAHTRPVAVPADVRPVPTERAVPSDRDQMHDLIAAHRAALTEQQAAEQAAAQRAASEAAAALLAAAAPPGPVTEGSAVAGRTPPGSSGNVHGSSARAGRSAHRSRSVPRMRGGATADDAAGSPGYAGYTGQGGVVGFALAQVGKRYSFGSDGPAVFDCSGLVAAAYRQVGLSLPHQTGALAAVGRPVARGDLRPGDLVFPSAGHVGIYIGGGRIVHASTERGGVKISPVYAFLFARRVS